MLKKCNLRILLDDPDESYHHGDTLSGEVELAPLDGIETTVLTLALQWTTDGLGDMASGAPETLTLYEGSLPPGRVQRYPFTFTIPTGPLTYHGKHLHVAWFLTAHADIPWALDTTVAHEINLEGTASTPLAALFPQIPVGSHLNVLLAAEPDTFKAGVQRQQQVDQLHQRGKVLVHWGKRVFHIFGSLMVFMGIAAFINDPDVGLPLTIFGAVFWGFSSFIFRMIGKFEASRIAPEEAGADAKPNLLRPGDTVQFTIQLAPEDRVRQATATLQGEEHVSYVRRTSDNRRETEHRRHTFYEEKESLDPIRIADSKTLQATFRLPHDAPASFNAAHNAIQWCIFFDVDIEDRPAPWCDSVALVVRP